MKYKFVIKMFLVDGQDVYAGMKEHVYYVHGLELAHKFDLYTDAETHIQNVFDGPITKEVSFCQIEKIYVP